MQKGLGALRTGLDSFSDLEALALMASAYRMTAHEFPDSVPGFPAPAAGPVPWPFLTALDAWMTTPVQSSDERLQRLHVGPHPALRFWPSHYPPNLLAP